MINVMKCLKKIRRASLKHKISSISRFISDAHTNEAFISEMLENKLTRIVLFNRLIPLINNEKENRNVFELTTLTSEQFKEINNKELKIFIASENHQLAVSFADSNKIELPQILKDKFKIYSFWMDNPFDYLQLGNTDYWIKLRGLYSWHFNNLFCGVCGAETISVNLGYKRICKNSNCISKSDSKEADWINYPRIDPVIIILPETKTDPNNGLPACLLTRKDIFPPGLISCITGYINAGECGETAAVRELKEDLNLQCENIQYQSSEYWPMPSSLFLAYAAKVPPSSTFHLDENHLTFADWFNVKEVKLLLERKHPVYFIPPEFSILYQLINNWYTKTK